MAASRRETAARRQQRRKTLGLGVGRPKKGGAAPAPAAVAEHAVELDLSAINCEHVAEAKEQQAERIAQEIAERRAAFEGTIAALVAQRKRLLAEASAFRKAHLKV